METLKLKAMKVEQPIGTFYVSKISANTLADMAKADIRRIRSSEDYYFGVQRKLDASRVAKIRDYLNTHDATFPNSIIVNLKSNFLSNDNIKEDEISIFVRPDTFTIIDGQHRLAGFIDNPKDNFDLIITIFIDLEDEQQARVFTTINSEHRRVSPSLSYDLEHYSQIRTPRKVAHNIAVTFNADNGSPWFNKIKMLGYKDKLSSDGIITQAAFVKPILNFIYNDEDYYSIREELSDLQFRGLNQILELDKYNSSKYPLWNFYATDNEKAMYKILFNYFSACKKTFKNQWGSHQYILTKTVGYYAMMKLFADLYLKGYKHNDLTYDFFYGNLENLISLKEKLTSSYYGSGEHAVTKMYEDFKSNMKLDNDSLKT